MNVETPVLYIANFVVFRILIEESDISLSNNVITIQQNTNNKKEFIRKDKIPLKIYSLRNMIKQKIQYFKFQNKVIICLRNFG